MTNGVQLIVYPDSFGANLRELRTLLRQHYLEHFTGLHVLPFFPSSGDRGFSPLTYREVEPTLGSWEDIHQLAEEYELIADFMVNHISRSSPQFLDWEARAEDSVYHDLFLPLSKFYTDGRIPNEDLKKIYTRKPRPPWTEVQHHNGTRQKIWCTFSEEQIDIDVRSAVGQQYICEELHFLADQGCRIIRLDACGYIIKNPGTSCFFEEPEIWQVLQMIRKVATSRKMELLPEVHEHYHRQMLLSQHGYYVYDFSLPMLMLHALYSRDAIPLRHWLSICPRRQITTLDTHDGIGIVDVKDLLTGDQIDFTVEKLYAMGSNVNRRYSSAQYQNLDIYQINCSYYSALGDDDTAYLIARAVQFFTPGIPQVYYVGLLAGSNDIEQVERTKQGRSINRHNYPAKEINEEISRPVVQKLRRLIYFRTHFPSFQGEFTLHEADSHCLHLSWHQKEFHSEKDKEYHAEIFVDLRLLHARINATREGIPYFSMKIPETE